MKKRKVITKLCSYVLCIIAVFCIVPIKAKSWTQAAIDRKYELIDQGYSGEVIIDQLYEEFQQVNGPYGTGGIDGLKLDGTPAGGSSSVNTTTSQPSAPAHTHSWTTEIIKDATCREKGEIRYTCSGCGESYTEGTPLVEHNFEMTSETPATCIAPASVTFTCTVCGETIVEEKGELADHIYITTNDSYEATCEEAGYLHYVCSVCGDEYEEYPEALGHDWDDEYTVDTKSGCETEGSKSIHCKRCGAVKEGSEQSIEPMGHTPNEQHERVEATFLKDGEEIIRCINCGEVMETIILSATGSIWQIVLPIVIAVIVVIAVVVGIILIKKKKKE